MYGWVCESVSENCCISVKERLQMARYQSLEYLLVFPVTPSQFLVPGMHCPIQPPSGKLVRGRMENCHSSVLKLRKVKLARLSSQGDH